MCCNSLILRGSVLRASRNGGPRTIVQAMFFSSARSQTFKLPLRWIRLLVPGMLDLLVQDNANDSIRSTSDMNWNNQPSLSSYIDRVTANRFRAQSQNSRWYYVDLTSDILNNAVHANTLVALRQSHTRGDLVCWHSQQSSGGSYKAYIAFDYTTCDANAHCSNSACVCNPGYSFGTSGQCERTQMPRLSTLAFT